MWDDMPQIFLSYGVSLRHIVCLIFVRQTVIHLTLSSSLSNVTFLRATVAFSTAEYVPGSSHSCYDTREPCMIKTIYTAMLTLTQHVRPLLSLNKCVACNYEQEISKQKKLISRSFIQKFLSHRQQVGMQLIKVVEDETGVTLSHVQ